VFYRNFPDTKAQEAGIYGVLIFYALGILGGIAFGWLQCRFLVWIIGYQGKTRPLFMMVKLLLWAACMVLLALWSIPLLICFVAGATAAMLISLFIMRRRSKEE
jgi:hypothetical protein